MEKGAGTGPQKHTESSSSHAQKGKGESPTKKLVFRSTRKEKLPVRRAEVAPRHESSLPLSPAPLHENPLVSETETPPAKEKSTIAEEKSTELPVAPGRLPTFFQNRDLWSAEEDAKLKHYASEYNKNWKKISGLLNGRSAHDCMMRYHTRTAPIGGVADQIDLEKIHQELAEMKMEVKTSVGELKDEIQSVRVETLTAIHESTGRILSQLGK